MNSSFCLGDFGGEAAFAVRCVVRLSAAIALCTFVGCASVSTHAHVRHGTALQAGPPEIIYVQDFDAPAEVFRVDRPEEDAKELRQMEADRLTRNIVWRVRDRIGPAVGLTNDKMPEQGPYWLVTGKFVRVNQGSRALRMLLGFGSGATKLETDVEVFDMTTVPPTLVMQFKTTGGSNAQPGAIANLTWWSAAASGSLLALSGIRFDITRTSREITAALSEELELLGNHPPDKRALRPKRLGKWP